jgi:hypothetical protein
VSGIRKGQADLHYMFMQVEGLVKLFSATNGNPFIAPEENCKFPVQLCKRFSMVSYNCADIRSRWF